MKQAPSGRVLAVLVQHPTMFYRWQKDFFENGAAAFPAENSASRKLGPTTRPNIPYILCGK
jgi:hypothetical protein